MEKIVFEAMKNRIKSLTITKSKRKKSDTETENLKSEIIRADTEIRQLMDKLADADKVLFDYIQKRITELHSKKSELENKLNTRERKNKTVDVQPLTEPLQRWDELSVDEKHEVAVTMIDAIYVSDETGVDIKFSI